MVRKLLISLFCLLNLAAVLEANQPEAFKRQKNAFLATSLSPQSHYRLRYTEWLIGRYAHLAGLDNRWKMFSTLHRFDWRYVIKARYGDGSEEVLPLARQSERSLLESTLFDFKEAKFHLNIYEKPDLVRAYGRFLCRETEKRASKRPVFITFELEHRMFLDRAQAAELRTHSEPTSHTQLVQAVDCAWAKPRLKGSAL